MCHRHIIVLIWFSVFVISCGKPGVLEKQIVSTELTYIDSLMWHQPDSALKVMMQFAASPEADSLNEFDGHYCQLLVAELLFKNDYAQSNRTELMAAMDYFDSLTDVRDAPRASAPAPITVFLDARAHYMNGVGYKEHDSLTEACAEYLRALQIMENRFAENELVGKKARFMALTYGRLGDLFSGQFMQEPAIYCYKEALVYNRIAPTSPYGISNNLYRIGRQYDKLKVADSAAYYYDRALELLPDKNNIIYRDIVSSRALFDYEWHHDTIGTLDSLKRMATQAANERERLNRFPAIGNIYRGVRQYDSAKAYLMPVFESENEAIDKKIAARLLRDIALVEGDTLKANQYSQYLFEGTPSAAINQAQVSKLNDLFQIYLQKKQEAASLRERRKAVRLTLMILVPLLLAIGLAVAIVMRRRHRKRLAMQEAEAQQRLDEERQSHRLEQAALSGRLKRSNETLRELQDQVRQQGEPTTKPETQAASFAEEPICRLIMQRVNEGQFKSQMDCTIYKDYALGKEQVTTLREAADRHFNQFTSRIAKAYPDLTRGDLDYCCLYLLGLSDADIAALMQKAYSTVSDRSRKLKNIFGNEKPLPTLMLDFANGKTLI